MRLGINGRFFRAAVTGVQRFAREVTTRLSQLTDVTLLLPRGVEPPDLNGAQLRCGRLNGHAWEQLELPGLARAAGCDVTLHLSGTSPLHGGPHVLMIHDVLPLTNPEWYSRRFARWYGALLPRAARHAAAILTVSELSRKEILRVLRVSRRPSVVPQGLAPFDRPADSATTDAVRTRFHLLRPFLLAVRHGDPRKNHRFLFEVQRELERRGEQFDLVIVGEASRKVHGSASMTGSPDVRLLGHVSDEEMQALYTAAAALCFPSFAEGFGRPPLEAAACGTPALIADLPAVAEPGRSAGMALPLVTEAWTHAVIALTHDSELRNQIVQRGRAAAAGLNWDDAAARVLEACVEAADLRTAQGRALHVSGV